MIDSADQPDLRPATVGVVLAACAGIVIAACWAYLTDGQAPYGDDNSAHLALMMHIAELWRSGVTDLWWNQSNLGLPLFMAYQPLPGLVSGTLGAFVAETGTRIFIYKLTIVGLWATMPAAWYLGARWLGCDRGTSLVFGVLTLAVRDLHAVGFGFTAVADGGLYTLVWGMWFLPMTVGAFRRYVVERDLALVVPVGLFVVLSMSHLFCGMFAGLATAIWVAVSSPNRAHRSDEPTGAGDQDGSVGSSPRLSPPSDKPTGAADATEGVWADEPTGAGDQDGSVGSSPRLSPPSDEPTGTVFGRALRVYLPALGLLAFWLGPLLWTNHLAGGLPWKGEYYNGWPVAELFERLLTGDVFDHDRLPWLTVLVVVGVAFTIQRASRAVDRWLWALSGLTVVLFMGRTNFGDWYDLIPMHGQINVMRYTAGVHFCGLLFAAVAARPAVGWIRRKLTSGSVMNPRVIAVGVGLLAAVSWYGVDRYQFFERKLATFDQRHENVRALVDELAEDRETRFAVSDQLYTSPHFYRDLLPTLADRAQLQSYALGYHATLSTYYADYIKYEPTWMRLFNVGAFVAREPYNEGVVEDFEETHHQGPYHVFEPAGGADYGWFDFVRTPAVVEGDYHAIRPGVRQLLVPGFERRALPILRGPTERSAEAGAPVLEELTGVESIPWSRVKTVDWIELMQQAAPDAPVESTVVSTERGPNWYEAEVEAEGGDERLMLKANYFPFWRATVDGEPIAIDHVAPNFMAVDVPAGRHRVRFTYRNPWWQKAGFMLSMLLLTGWGLWRWRRTRIS